jgi:class 3 adenylate cyclase
MPMTGHPPSGTVTFMLTDLEGSTRLWEHDPDAMTAAMARHDELLEKTIAAHRGYVARDAVCAASAFQQALAAEQSRA